MSTQPSPSAPRTAPAAAPPWAALFRIPLPWAAGLVLGLAALCAALLAWGLTPWLAGSPWLAPVAAGLAVALATLPMAALLHRLTRGSASSPASGAIHSPIGAARPLFMELAGREWTRSRRYGTGAALLIVDVDRFARQADARGADTASAASAVLAQMLSLTAPTLRGADLLTRFSDTQMAVFLAQADATGALDVAERLRERVEQMEVPQIHVAARRPQRLTVSVGVAQLRPAHLNLQALIDDAQDAVLAARQAGGNCVRAAPVDMSRLRASDWRDGHRARPN